MVGLRASTRLGEFTWSGDFQGIAAVVRKGTTSMPQEYYY